MGCVIRIHHQNISPEEREYRVEQIKKRTIEYMREVLQERKTLEEREKECSHGNL